MSWNKRKLKRKRKRDRRRRINRLRHKASVFGFHLVEGDKMREWGIPEDLLSDNTDHDFYLRGLRDPRILVAMSTLEQVEEFIDQYWRLKVFI